MSMNALLHGRQTMASIKSLNNRAGQHWFSKGTMAYFGTIVDNETNRYNMFITSEKDEENGASVRRYTIRMFNPKRSQIATIGAFSAIATKAQARHTMRLISAQLDEIRESNDPDMIRVFDDLYGAEVKDGKLVFSSYGKDDSGLEWNVFMDIKLPKAWTN